MGISPSVLLVSTLLTATKSGFLPRRSRSAMERSTLVSPSRPSTTSTTAAASSVASWACCRTCVMSRSRDSGSKPPVSTSDSARPSQIRSA